MDALLLSRLQFAAATYFHFLFVPLTLGLSLLIAIMETLYVKRGDEDYRLQARFWGKLFLINFAIGVVTGITLEFQFGTNWSRYSKYVGDVFGSLLAVEATVAFFLESTFVAVWFFGWKRLKPKTHAVVAWLVAVGGNVSAFWILVANSWMQHPVGYVIRNGRAELDDFWAILFQPFAIHTFIHTISAAYILSGFFVMAFSAYHLLKKSQTRFFNRSFRLGLGLALIFSVVSFVQGHLHGAEVAKHQPAKLAAMEAHWDTQKGATWYLFALPDPGNERNLVQIGVPGILSLLATHSLKGEVKGLKAFKKEDRPPVLLTFFSFRIMVALGMLFLLLTFWGWLIRKKLETSPFYLKVIKYALPLPYLACTAGWTVTEVGRQPWIVYGLMRTKDASSTAVTSGQVGVSLIAFIIIYGLLGLAAFYLIFKTARQGPEPLEAAAGQGV